MNKLSKATYRKVKVDGKDIELDSEIPLLRRIPKDPAKARAFLEKKIRGTTQENWSHPQVAIPVSALDLSQLDGYSKTRLSIPLPGEALFTPSYRMGKLHAHERGPVYLMHEDESEPGGIRSTLEHIPEAITAIRKRFDAPEPVKLAAKRSNRPKPKPKLKVLYIDETGAGHRSQSKNVVEAAKKIGIDAEAIDWSAEFGSRKAGKEYRKDYLNFLDKKSLTSVVPLAKSHIDYHFRSTDKDKLNKFLKNNKNSAIMLAHPLLMDQFRGADRPISLLHTDPVKWPGTIHLPSMGKRQHIGVDAVTEGYKDKKLVKGLAVSQTLLQKKLPKSGLLKKKDFNITISGGGEGLEVGEMTERVLNSGKLPSNAKIHAVTGRNEALNKKLQGLAKKDKRLVVHGFAPLGSMMREADLNVIRAHGTTYAETLTSGKPAVYYGPKFNLLDLQGTMTRRTAQYGHKKTKYPHAVGHEQITTAVDSALDNYKTHMQKAISLKKSYGDPGAQAALGAIQYHKEHTKKAADYRNYIRDEDLNRVRLTGHLGDLASTATSEGLRALGAPSGARMAASLGLGQLEYLAQKKHKDSAENKHHRRAIHKAVTGSNLASIAGGVTGLGLSLYNPAKDKVTRAATRVIAPNVISMGGRELALHKLKRKQRQQR